MNALGARFSRVSLVAVSFLMLASCASSPPAGTSAGSAGAAPAAASTTAAAPTGPWKDMNKDQRLAYMKQVVFPKMKDDFSAFNAHYNDMTCKTCHGDGAAAGNFKMPNPQLPRLPAPGHPEGFQKLMAEKGPVMEFMGKIVKPHMAQLLSETEFNPQTNTGEFGCFACHTHD